MLKDRETAAEIYGGWTGPWISWEWDGPYLDHHKNACR